MTGARRSLILVKYASVFALCLVLFQNCSGVGEFSKMVGSGSDPASSNHSELPVDSTVDSESNDEANDRPAEIVAGQEVKIALLGDTEAGSDFGEALALAAAENVNVIMINGDLGYNSSPEQWKNRVTSSIDINKHLVIGSLGNHDTEDGDNAYPPIFGELRTAENQLNSKCTGIQGISEGHDIVAVDEVCTFGNVTLIASAIGQVLSDSYLEDRLEQKLSAAPSNNWKLVGYHYTLAAMNPGIKGNENTYRFFDLIRQYGALGAQAHTHTVMASCPISSPFAAGAQVQCHPNFGSNLAERFVSPGVGMYFDSSLGGKGVRALDRCNEVGEANCAHMVDLIGEQGYVRTDGETQSNFNRTGVLFVTFNKGGDSSKAFVYFKSIDGQVIFSFNISR